MAISVLPPQLRMLWQVISSYAVVERPHGRELIWLPPKSSKLAYLKYNSG